MSSQTNRGWLIAAGVLAVALSWWVWPPGAASRAPGAEPSPEESAGSRDRPTLPTDEARSARVAVAGAWSANVKLVKPDGSPWRDLELAVETLGARTLFEGRSDACGRLQFPMSEPLSGVSLRGEHFRSAEASLVSRGDGILDYGRVVLRPSAWLEVTVTGISAGAEVHVVVGYAPDPDDPAAVATAGPSWGPPVREGVARAKLLVDAERELFVVVSADGAQRSTRDHPRRLKVGASDQLWVRMDDGCELLGRLRDIPTTGAGRWRVMLRCLESTESSVGVAASSRWTSLVTSADEDGQFRFSGLTADLGLLSLDLGGDWLPLRPVGSPFASFQACMPGGGEFEPAVEVVWVTLPEEAEGARRGEWTYALDGEPFRGLRPARQGAMLLVRADIERARELALVSTDLGVATLANPAARIDADGRLRTSSADWSLGTGSIEALVESTIEPGWTLECDGVSALRFSSNADRDRVLKRSSSAGGFVFQPLVLGRYRLVWTKGALRLAASEVIEVAAASEVHVKVDPPRCVELNGRVEGWPQLTPQQRPIALRVEGYETTVKDGRFRWEFEAPPPRVGIVLPGGWIPESDAELEHRDGGLVLRIGPAPASVTQLTIPPLHGGDVVVRIPRPPRLRREYEFESVGFRADSRGRLHIPSDTTVRRGCVVTEITGAAKFFRGWVDVPASAPEFRAPCEGRFVELEFDSPRAIVELSACPADEPDRVVALDALDTARVHSIWLPRQRLTLRATFSGGPTVSVDVPEHLDRLVFRAPPTPSASSR
mgnify:CR=1 FL=1